MLSEAQRAEGPVLGEGRYYFGIELGRRTIDVNLSIVIVRNGREFLGCD